MQYKLKAYAEAARPRHLIAWMHNHTGAAEDAEHSSGTATHLHAPDRGTARGLLLNFNVKLLKDGTKKRAITNFSALSAAPV